MVEYSGDMFQYIMESKEITRNIVENQGTILKEAVDYYMANDNAIEEIYIIGSGTSYHAGVAAKTLIENVLNLKVMVSYPIIFKDNERIFNNKGLVIGVSHGGASASTIYGLIKGREEGLKTIACTAEHNTKIVNYGDAKFYFEVGPEDAGPKTKGFIGAIVTLVLFALNVAVRKGTITEQEKAEYEAKMIMATDNIPAIAEAAVQWYNRNSEELKQSRRILIVGYENNIATYLEGALKILETVRYSVTGFELEEFMHGIYNSVDEDTYLLYIGSKGQYYERILNLKSYLDGKTSHNFLICGDKSQESERNLVFDFVDDFYFSVLEFIVPLQVIANKLSIDLGINCNIPSDPKFHQKMRSKL